MRVAGGRAGLDRDVLECAIALVSPEKIRLQPIVGNVDVNEPVIIEIAEDDADRLARGCLHSGILGDFHKLAGTVALEKVVGQRAVVRRAENLLIARCEQVKLAVVVEVEEAVRLGAVRCVESGFLDDVRVLPIAVAPEQPLLKIDGGPVFLHGCGVDIEVAVVVEIAEAVVGAWQACALFEGALAVVLPQLAGHEDVDVPITVEINERDARVVRHGRG